MTKGTLRFLAIAAVVSGLLTIHVTSNSVARADATAMIESSSLIQYIDSLQTISHELDATINRLALANEQLHSLYGLTAPDTIQFQKMMERTGALASMALSSMPNTHPAALLSMRIIDRQRLLGEMTLDYFSRLQLIERMPLIVPCDGRVTSDFGMRRHPIARRRKMHTGIDIAAPWGTPIYATGKGTVSYAGWKRGYGRVVKIDHGFGYETLYAHCTKLLVKEGDEVERGHNIALMGSTGRSTGSHVHYEVIIDNETVDPNDYMVHQLSDTTTLQALHTMHMATR